MVCILTQTFAYFLRLRWWKSMQHLKISGKCVNICLERSALIQPRRAFWRFFEIKEPRGGGRKCHCQGKSCWEYRKAEVQLFVRTQGAPARHVLRTSRAGAHLCVRVALCFSSAVLFFRCFCISDSGRACWAGLTLSIFSGILCCNCSYMFIFSSYPLRSALWYMLSFVNGFWHVLTFLSRRY